MTSGTSSADEQQHHQRDAVDAEGEVHPEVGIQATTRRAGTASPPVSNATAATTASTSTTRLTPSATCLARLAALRQRRDQRRAHQRDGDHATRNGKSTHAGLDSARRIHVRVGPCVDRLRSSDVTASSAPATSTAPPSMRQGVGAHEPGLRPAAAGATAAEPGGQAVDRAVDARGCPSRPGPGSATDPGASNTASLNASA